MPADATLSNGTGSFSATLRTGGNQTITGTDTSDLSTNGTSNQIVVSEPATHFAVVGTPPGVPVGVSFAFGVVALDQFNNTVTNYSGTVHFTSTDGSASLPADYTFTAGDHGGHTFFAAFHTRGVWTITATDTSNPSITGTSSPIQAS